METRWRIELLGGLRAVRGDQVVARFRSRKTALLLAYLAYYAQRSHPREELVELLWPETEPEAGRQSLRKALSSLRQELDPGGEEGAVFLADRATVALAAGAVTTDVAEFRLALRAPAPPEGGGEPAATLARAVEQYGGELLPGYHEDWILGERQWLAESCFRALEQLLGHLERRGEYERALEYAHRAVMADPLREEAHRHLIRLYAAAGQTPAALRQYRELERRLREHLGLAPEPATLHLIREIERLSQLRPQPTATVTVPAPRELISPTAPTPATGENRLVTVLFADMSQSLARTAELAPDEAAAEVDRLLTAMVDAVLKFGGRVDRFLGDGVLATFGVPQAHEDDAERAIGAALAIREAARCLEMQVTAGINTGEVYVGEVGSERHHEATVVGPVVSLASRLQGLAEPSQVLVGEATYRLARGAYEFSSRSLAVRGLSEPVPAYVVEQVRSRPEKLRGIEGLRAELIGRDEELDKLRQALARVLQPDEPGGQMVSLVAEAGVGKSRLVAELRQVMSDERWVMSRWGSASPQNPPSPTHHSSLIAHHCLWLEGRCLEMNAATGYSLFVDLFRDYFAWKPEETDAARGLRLAARLDELVACGDLSAEQRDEIGPLLGNLLSLRFGTHWDERLKNASPEQIRHQTLGAVRDFFVALSRQQPALLVLEDLHWADALSLDLIALLMETLAEAPLLLLCVYRPEREHGCWRLAPLAGRKCPERFTELRLRELTPRQSRQMVESLLTISELPPILLERIYERSRGNPFFVEEVVRALIDAGMLYREGGTWKARPRIERFVVPESVQSVILSRVDRLRPDLKQLLQRAGVIGRLFRRRLLEVTMGDGHRPVGVPAGNGSPSPAGPLTAALWELEEQGLIYQERAVPEEEYSFQHVLTQETVYNSLPRRQREPMHQQVAEAMEALYQAQIQEYYELLAFHYSRSENREKAIEYLFKAGQQAIARYANQEALDYFEKALSLAKGSEKYDAILARRARLLLDLFQGNAAATDYEYLLDRARQCENRGRELEALLGLARTCYVIALDDPSFALRSRELYEAAYTLARDLGDKTGMVRALLATTALQSFWSSEIRDQAMAHAREALALSREIGDEALIIDSKLVVLNHTRCTSPREAEEQGEELLPQIEARHDLLKLKELYYHLIPIHTERGNFARAIELCDISIKLSEKFGVSPVQYPTYKAVALLHLGRYRDAWEALQTEVADDLHRLGAAMKDLGTSFYFLELMAYENASRVSRSVIEQADLLRRPWMKRSAQSVLAKSLIRSGKLADADLRRMVQEVQSARDLFSSPAELMAEFYFAQGRLDHALQQSEEAASQAEQGGYRPGYVSAAELRLRVLLRMDRPVDAAALATEALHVAEEVSYLPMVWRVRAGRAQALSMIGNTEAAALDYQAATAVIGRLANAIGDSELRRGFVSNALVASILATSSHCAGTGQE